MVPCSINSDQIVAGRREQKLHEDCLRKFQILKRQKCKPCNSKLCKQDTTAGQWLDLLFFSYLFSANCIRAEFYTLRWCETTDLEGTSSLCTSRLTISESHIFLDQFHSNWAKISAKRIWLIIVSASL